MAAKELIMLDESKEEMTSKDKNIAIVLPDDCDLKGNMLIMSLNEALSVAANITIQAAMLV